MLTQSFIVSYKRFLGYRICFPILLASTLPPELHIDHALIPKLNKDTHILLINIRRTYFLNPRARRVIS
jgi:hypothetical protein